MDDSRTTSEYAVEQYAAKTRCKPTAVQHVVSAKTGGTAPWSWSVLAKCGRMLRRASIKPRPFLEPRICEECLRA